MKAKRKRNKLPEYTPQKVEKESYNNMYGQPRTQDELRDFFQKSALQWGHRSFEIGI